MRRVRYWVNINLEIYTKVPLKRFYFLKRVYLKDLEHLSGLMVMNIKVNGNKIINMEKEFIKQINICYTMESF